jgi:DNA-3-methyladenine glycosylase
MAKLRKSFYLRSDVVGISRELLGKYLFTRKKGGAVTGGIIVETEAYSGPEDRASHAYGNRRTARNEIMFHVGGVVYVYLCYGIHSLLNVVTNREGIPHAILIRAVQPVRNPRLMLRRRKKKVLDRTVAGGPGALGAALGIDCSYNGKSLLGNEIWIEDRGDRVASRDVVASPRIGVAYAGPDAARRWRFRVRDSEWTSQAK